MSSDNTERQQQKAREFMNLLPLTMALAGLPDAESGRYFNEGQLDARSTAIRAAYKIARQIIMDVVK
jgi:hypothetical protein